jgi:hypothetical protein
MRGNSPEQREKPMKMQRKIGVGEDKLRREYDLRKLLKGGVRGKYVDRYRAGTNLILLKPEVAAVFPTDRAVNDALKSLIGSTRHPVRPARRFSRRVKA